MTNRKDEDGNLLPDADRLTRFGKVLVLINSIICQKTFDQIINDINEILKNNRCKRRKNPGGAYAAGIYS